jgi:hypothetical protein
MNKPETQPEPLPQAPCSEASDPRPVSPKVGAPCVLGHAEKCDNLCGLWGCRFIHNQLLTAKQPNTVICDTTSQEETRK